MKVESVAKLGCLALLALTVAGCGGSASSISARDPNFFFGRVSENTMSGAFNANGFSTSQVRSLLSDTCEGGRLTGFNTQNREDGLTAFAATCSRWKNGARAVEYERSSGSNVVVEITGSNGSGAITYNRFDVSV